MTSRHEGANVYWTYSYDALGKVTEAKKGSSAGGEETAKTERYYNGLGRLSLETQQITGGLTKSASYDYDQAGNVTALYYPGGDVTIERAWTVLNQINTITRYGGSDDDYLADYDYLGNRVIKLTYMDGTDVVADMSYDGMARLTRLAWSQGGKTYPQFNYDFDDVGNILTKTHDHRSGNDVEEYGYDDLYRITRVRYEPRTLTHEFVYDGLGNRLTFTYNGTEITHVHNEVNEINSVDGTTMYWDDAGNLTKDDASSGPYAYYYDADNRLTKIEDTGASAVASYEYDALGRRIEFIDEVGNVTKQYCYDGERVIEEYNAAATPVRQRYYVWGNYIDELLLMYDDGGTADYQVCYNQLFSPAAVLDASDNITETYQYDAYGTVTIFTEDGGDSDWWDGDEVSTAANEIGLVYLFTGREHDCLDSDNLNLYYYRARTYHPELNRFLQRDPIGYIDGMNFYQYVRSNPILWLDPKGVVGVPAIFTETVNTMNERSIAMTTAINSIDDAWDLAMTLADIHNAFAAIVEERDLKNRAFKAVRCVMMARFKSLHNYTKCLTGADFEGAEVSFNPEGLKDLSLENNNEEVDLFFNILTAVSQGFGLVSLEGMAACRAKTEIEYLENISECGKR